MTDHPQDPLKPVGLAEPGTDPQPNDPDDVPELPWPEDEEEGRVAKIADDSDEFTQ